MRRTASGLMLALLIIAMLVFSFNAQAGGVNGTICALADEVHVPVPFFYQEQDYYCGPAALQMVFSYYGEKISQPEIACVARSIGDPLYTTYTDELRRAGHFSNVSTSMGDELPNNITGYTLRQLGYAAFEAYGVDLTTLKNFLDQGKPLILLMWYSSYHRDGHYRVATGYNQTHIFLHDPLNKPLWGGTYGGPNIAFNNSQFLDLWSYSGNWTLYVSPWIVTFSAPACVEPETPFQVESTITYPQPLPNALSNYPASSCNASINLPANLNLAQGENQKKTVGTGFLQAGDSSSLNWTLTANSSVVGQVGIAVEGSISGSVAGNPTYPAYSYFDRIGATVNLTVTIASGHDIAVTKVLPSKTIVGKGNSMDVSLTVANQSGYTENFNVTVHANTATINTLEFNLTSGSNATQVVVWDTAGSAYGNYTLWAYAEPVSGETNTANNNCTGDSVVTTIPGDVDGNFKVDMGDISALCDGFGS